MNKKFLVGITTVLVSAFMAYGVSKSMNNSNTELSELALANIEALAQDEGGFIISIGVTFPIDDFSIRSNRCVCKRGECSDGAWISFRKSCGEGDSDSACATNPANKAREKCK